MIGQLPTRPLVPCLVLMLGSTPVWADEERETGWFNSAELSFVSTAGNSDATTLGFGNILTRVWTEAEFRLEVGAVRSQSRGDRFAVGAPGEGNFVVKDPPRRVDTERYFGKANYSRSIATRFFWFVEADAERNTPANIRYRYTGTGGMGNSWIDTDNLQFRTTYGVNYTNERLAVEGRRDFGGFRLGYAYQNQLTETTRYNSDLTFDDNFDDLKDHRTDFYNAVAVSVSEQLALKVGLRLLYRNLPALEEVEIFDSDPNEGPATSVGTGSVEKDKLDSNFSTSLVLTF